MEFSSFTVYEKLNTKLAYQTPKVDPVVKDMTKIDIPLFPDEVIYKKSKNGIESLLQYDVRCPLRRDAGQVVLVYCMHMYCRCSSC